MFLPRDLAGEADKHFNLPFWEKPLTLSALLYSDLRGNKTMAFEKRLTQLFLFFLICFLCLVTKQQLFVPPKCRSKVQPACGSAHGYHRAAAWILQWKQTSNPTTNSLSHLSFTQQGYRICSPLPNIFPFLCSDLQPSSLCIAVHLSTSPALTISSHCSSLRLHPDPFSSAPAHLWWQHPIDINDTTE